MISDRDSNGVLTREEREELVLDLYFKEKKTYHEIAKIARMSPRDIKPIIDKAYQEKERTEHKSTAVQAYEHFYKGKTPLEVAIILNIGQAQATAYYAEYLKLVQLDDITQIYRELQGGVWDFVKLCKAVKAAKMGISQVVNLLRIANNYLPLAENKYEELQKQNSILDSNLHTAAKEFQSLTNQISFMSKKLDELKLKYENQIARFQDLRYQAANLQTVVNEFKNDGNGEYTKVIKAVKEEVQKNLLDIKPLLDLALFSIIQSMRDNPDKYSCLVCSNNSMSIRDSHHKYASNGQQQQQSQHADYSVEDCKTEILNQAKEFYLLLVDRFICEVINGSASNTETAALPSALILEVNNNKQEHSRQIDIFKDKQ